jgi:hypothetical protein
MLDLRVVSLTLDHLSSVRRLMKYSKCTFLTAACLEFCNLRVYRTGTDELLETAMALHAAAMKDEYFIRRKLAPNVDFWYVFGQSS